MKEIVLVEYIWFIYVLPPEDVRKIFDNIHTYIYINI